MQRVDFTFSGYTYSIKGGSSIRLSLLAQKLGLRDTKQDKDFDVADVDDVTFSDSSLVEVTKKDGDWELVSKKPFTSTEKLTISMKDGSQYEVEVKDEVAEQEDITGNLTSATIKINGQDVTEGPWNVKANNSYDITLHFAENSNSQFPNDGKWMTYPIPTGLIIDNMNKPFDMVINKGKFNETIIRGNTMVVDKEQGLIKFKWNTADENFKALQDSDDAYIDVDISGSFGSDTTEIIFNNSVTRTIKVDSTHNARVYKYGQYDSNDGKIHYTVTVDSSGTSKDVVVTDAITGKALKYDQNVTYTSTKGATARMETKDNGFTATIPSMSDGEVVKFTYTASVDLDKLKQSGTVTQDETSNEVHISCPGDKDEGDNSTTQFVNNISFSSLGKNAKSDDKTYTTQDGKTYRDITWTINANEERKKHITHISDSINSDSQDIMTYSGDGLTIVVTKGDGKTETRNVPWNDSQIQMTGIGTGWTYTPPEDDGNASYKVTYTTKADVTKLIASRNVSNSAQTDYNSTTGSASVSPSKANEFSASKSVVALADDKTTWEIKVNVPAIGLDKLVVDDTLPSIWQDNEHLVDSFSNDITVNGLEGEEFYDVIDQSDDNNQPKFSITFYKNRAKKTPGMNSSTGNRTITIRYTTNNKEEWMEYGKKNPDNSYLVNHTNTAQVNNLNVQAVATYKPSNPSEITITKQGSWREGDLYTDPDNQKWKIIEYNITLKGAKDYQTLTDTFDKTYLEYFDGKYSNWQDPSAGVIYCGTDPWNFTDQGQGRSGLTVQQPKLGVLEFNTGILPRQQDKKLFPYYRIHYYLKVRMSDLEQLAVEKGGTATLKNSVNWGTQNATADVTYEYPGVNKTCNYNPTTKTASYTITINPSAIEMNKGQPMQLVDTFTHQMIDYSSIKIAAHDATGKVDRSKEVTYSPRDGKLVFTIPDSTFIRITYDAKPSGASGKVEMTNTADLQSYHSTTTQWAQIDGSAGGGGTTTGLRLFKYEKNNMGVPLSGAVFQLLDADRKVLTYNTGENQGKPITFTTGDDGYVDIQLSNSTGYTGGLQKGTKYFLRETVAPDGYQITEDTPFTISTDGTYDYSKNLYANGETILVEDKKITKVSITLKKVDSGNTANTLSGAVFNLYGSDYINSDGSVNASANPINKSRLETGAGGTVSLGTLKSGTYYLVETTAPDGYTKETKPITVTVADDRVTVMQGTALRTSVIDTDTGQTAEITVTNSAGYALPSTGGPGDLPWKASGILMTLLAGAVFMMRKLLIYRSRRRGGGLRS